MFQKIIFFVVIFLFIVLQVFFVDNLFLKNNAPSLISLLIIFWTIKFGFEKTIKITIFSGIVLDVFYFWPIGISVLTLTSVSFLTSFLAKRFLSADFFSRVFWVVMIIALATLVQDLLIFTIFETLAFFQKIKNTEFILSFQIWKEAIYNIIIFSIIYWPLKKIESLMSFYNRKVEPKYYVK